MLTCLLLLRDWRWVVPAAVLSVPTVPYFVVAVGWGVISWPLPRRWFATVDDFMWSGYQRACLFFLENYSGYRLALYGDAAECLSRRENVLYVSNHQCTVDWAVADMVAVRQGSLGSLRYMLKDALQYLPLYGWYFYHHGCVYVRRGNFRKDITCKGLTYLSQLKSNVWLVIFPEGTRLNPNAKSLMESSRKFAESIGEEPLKHVLCPRSKGLNLVLESLRHRIDAVYDVTVAYSSTVDNQGQRVDAPSLGEFMVSPRGKSVHVHIRRIAIEQVPSSPELVDKWLFGLFRTKDKLLSPLFNGEKDATGSIFPDLVTPDNTLPLTNTFIPLLVLWAVTAPFFITKGGPRIFMYTWATGIVGAICWMRITKSA